MTLKLVISYALEASLFVLVLSVGLQSRLGDALYVLRRPALFLRALLAVNVVVPAVTVGLCLLLPVAPWTRAGLVMMAVSPLAPFAPLKMQKAGGARSYVIGTYVALMLAAVVVVPLTAAILSPIASKEVVIPVGFVARFVMATVLLPLAIGIAIHELAENFANRSARYARILAFVLIVPIALLILVRFASTFAGLVGDGTLAVIAATVVSGLVAGFLVGGRDLATRKALGEAAATRHPGLAAGIAQFHSNDPRILAALVLFLLVSVVVSAAFARILSRWHAEGPSLMEAVEA
ncbi:MAG TPA: hypothetical protein VHE36_03295 [Sphingomicrobium sp.]|nr:hypothetical protein [Sphingomicrobium sp.]